MWEIAAEDLESIGNNQYYIFFKGFNVARMSDSMYFTVYNGDTPVSNTYRYSVESYVYAHQNDSIALEPLVVAMMKYGKSVKAYI